MQGSARKLLSPFLIFQNTVTSTCKDPSLKNRGSHVVGRPAWQLWFGEVEVEGRSVQSYLKFPLTLTEMLEGTEYLHNHEKKK